MSVRFICSPRYNTTVVTYAFLVGGRLERDTVASVKIGVMLCARLAGPVERDHATILT